MSESEALYGREREWWAKGQSHVLRLAGVLAFMNWAVHPGAAKPTHITAGFIQAAVRLWHDYFWPHSRAALRQTGLTDDQSLARRVLKWIRANKEAVVSPARYPPPRSRTEPQCNED